MAYQGKAISNSYTGGMMLDTIESMQLPNTYRYARNAILGDKTAYGYGLSNEEANELVATVGAAIVGHLFVERLNASIIFAEGDIIGYFDHDLDEYKEVARASEFGCKWNFSTCSWIDSEFKTIQPCDELYVYFASGDCTYYRVNLSELLNPVRKAALIASIKAGSVSKTNCGYSCSYFHLLNCVCTPKITASTSENSGHSLESGAYKFAVQLEDNEGNKTNWGEVSQPIYVGSKSNQAGEITSSSISINLTGLDCRYDVVNIAVINGYGRAEIVASRQYSTDGITFTYYGQKGRAIDIEEIITKGKKYLRGRSLEQKDSRLYLYNIRQEKNPNMQRRVFASAKLQFITIQTSAKLAERYNLRSLAREENYLFGVVYKYCDGTFSPVFLMSPSGGGGGGSSSSSSSTTGGTTDGRTANPNSGQQSIPGTGGDSSSSAAASTSSSGSSYTPGSTAPASGKEEQYIRKRGNTRTGCAACCGCSGSGCSAGAGGGQNPNGLKPASEVSEFRNESAPFSTSLGNWTESAKCNDCHPPVCCSTDAEGNVVITTLPDGGDCSGCDEDEVAIATDGPDLQKAFVDHTDQTTYWANDTAQRPTSSTIKEAADNLISAVNNAEVVERIKASYTISTKITAPGQGEEIEETGNSEVTIPQSAASSPRTEVVTAQEIDNVAGDEKEDDPEITQSSRTPAPAPETPPTVSTASGIPWGDYHHNITGNSDLDGQIKVVEYWNPRTITTQNLYPDSKDCEGQPIYGGKANSPVELFGTPTAVQSPIIQPISKGVPNRFSPSSDPNYAADVRHIGIQVTGIPLPSNDEDWFPKPLCPNEPYRIVMVERDHINATVQANCLATSCFTANSGGQPHYFARHGMCSKDKCDIHVMEGESHKTDSSGAPGGYNLHGLDTNIGKVGLSGTKIKKNALVNAQGYRYGLYSEGKKPNDRLSGNRVDQRGARQMLNANLFAPQGGEYNIDGISYVNADEKSLPVTGVTDPVCNGYREASVFVKVSGSLGQEEDNSFKMDTMDHEVPISDAHGWNVSIIREIPDQYGAVPGMKFIDTGVRSNGRNGSVKGFTGDVFIGPYSVKRTGYVSDKVGNLFPTPQRDRTVCDSPDDLLLQNLDVNHYPTRLPKSGDKSDARNWAGGYLDQNALAVAGGGPPIRDFYYPKVQKTLIVTWLESRINPWKRATGIGDQTLSGMAYYPNLHGMHLDSHVLRDHPWEESFLNRFYYRVEQPSPAQLLRKALIKNIIEVIIPALGLLEASTKQLPTDITSYFLVLPGLISYWRLLKDVVTREDYLNKMVGISDCKTDDEGGELDNHITQFEDNYHDYNSQFSALTSENYYKAMPLNYNTCVCDSCTDKQTTNEIYYSNKQVAGAVIDAYKNFQGLAYNEIGVDGGKIRKLFKWNGDFFAHTTEGIYLIKYDSITTQTSRGLAVAGAAEHVLEPFALFEGIVEGHAGIQDPNSSITTPYGYFFIDREAKRLYRFDGKTSHEVSQKGMFNFFKEHIDFCEIGDCHDEKNEGSTFYSLGWDNRYNRLLITKKSQKQKESMTLSYYPLAGDGGKFVSFHDYIPQSYMWDRDGFYSTTGGKIYKHNIKDKYQNFYGKDVPFEVEFVANAGNQEWFTHKWTQIHTEAEKGDLKGMDVTFEKMSARNFTQGTGTMPFKLFTDNKDSAIRMLDRIEEDKNFLLQGVRRRYTFNSIIDYTLPRCETKPLTLLGDCEWYPRINESIYSCEVNQSSEFIQRRMKDDHLIYRLTYDGDRETKLRLLGVKTFVDPIDMQ
jgi:hypothetical protein